MDYPADLAQGQRFLTLLAEGEPVTFQTFSDGGKNSALARDAIRSAGLEPP